MTPTQAGALMRRARKLLRADRLTHRQLALLDCMVWSCRAPGSDRLSVSYSRMATLAHIARDTVRLAVSVLERLGLLRREKRRVRVAWGGGIASRQATNLYVLAICTEAAHRPVYREQEKKIGSTAVEQALSRLGAALGAAGLPAS